MTDQPIAHTADGRPVFDNTPTVVAMLVPSIGSPRRLLVVRRAKNPGRGLLALPGGYHMREDGSWQVAGCREVHEETGYVAIPSTVRQVGQTITDEYGNNMIFAKCSSPTTKEDPTTPEEVEEVLWLEDPGPAENWAFPLHHAAAYAWVHGIISRRMDDGL